MLDRDGHRSQSIRFRLAPRRVGRRTAIVSSLPREEPRLESGVILKRSLAFPRPAGGARQLSFPAGRLLGGVMSQVAILARVTVKKGKTGQYLAALAPLLEQARKEPGTLLYAVHRSADDPDVFWTTEIYANDEAFAAHRAADAHAAAAPVFTDLIAGAEVTVGETVMAAGLDR
jgi:(4S)-4-hydroxy-5-phosphonooxypentane-2,3-dione isomerase